MLITRAYGSGGPLVIAVHGGPGMAGSAAPLARGLAGRFRVIEPFQRPSGGEPLTVARHVADLHEVVAADEPPALVGHSWGAMLVLAYAAAHPRSPRCLALVGCGTFDALARAEFSRAVESRGKDARKALDELRATTPDWDERLARTGAVLLPAYSYDLASTDLELARSDARGFDETWADMMRRQEMGDYPEAFSAITCPVLMVHGAADPHPGPMIYDNLKSHLPQLEYRELERCGHYPWLERYARDDFFATLTDWLSCHFQPS